MEQKDNPGTSYTKLVIGVIIILLLVIFSVQNSMSTTVKVYFWDVNAPLVLLFVISFTLGLLLAVVSVWPISRHSKRKTKLIEQLESRVEFLESQLKQSRENSNKDNNPTTNQ